mgnify:CR=1 FL=1|jgi:cytochrome c-type biogenesis protein CcmH
MKKIILLFTIFLTFSNLILKSENINEIKIFKNIRCLICQGQSIADSNSDFAQTIKLVVKDQILEGKSEKEIYNFLIDKYGEWIVYKPTTNPQNFILWLTPYAILFIGGFIILVIVKKREKH